MIFSGSWLEKTGVQHLVSLMCPPWRWNIPSLLVPVLNAARYTALVFAHFSGS